MGSFGESGTENGLISHIGSVCSLMYCFWKSSGRDVTQFRTTFQSVPKIRIYSPYKSAIKWKPTGAFIRVLYFKNIL
jgi:hypothetical protein